MIVGQVAEENKVKEIKLSRATQCVDLQYVLKTPVGLGLLKCEVEGEW